jgi:DMSO/TMAO reductase YedYZ molybdopterin-dependent catalytic subunit
LPPGQRWTDEVIEYAVSGVPRVDIRTWRLRIHGHVDRPVTLTIEELTALGLTSISDDLHCVEGWSVRGIVWEGVPLKKVLDLSRPKPSATHIMLRCADRYSTVVSIEHATSHPCYLVTKMNGRTLTPESGYPLRLVAQGIYAWKYAKWLSEVELLDHYEAGYWEARGYHPRGDVWKEQRRSE